MTGKASRQAAHLERLRAAQAVVAELVIEDPVYSPIFERLEREIAMAEAAQSPDIIARARAVAASHQMASF